MVWFGFLDLFLVFLDLMEIGLATRFVSWIWNEHEKQVVMFL